MSNVPTVRTRNTVQKDAVLHALEAAPGFVSAQQLHQDLRDAGTPVGIATVYRQLGALAESGQADTITLPVGQLYRACRPSGHHHHLICEHCGRAVDIDPPSEDWIRATADAHGYTVTSHVLEVFGLCPDCRATAVTAS